MASQALYRKWRSQTFEELVGQEHVVQTLRNAITEDRVAHAYLFTGPRGVGKTSMARLLAKAVNCTAPLPERPCGVCDSCRAIVENRAVDVIEMDAASHTSVDDARDLIERVQFRPASGRYKVYVIDEVHMLSTAAFNALLKTLEEPPGHALFILATTEIHKVPATILSRCQRFTFTRHTISQIAGQLQKIAEQEGLTLEAGVAPAIARAATGSMRDALGVLEQLASFSSGSVALEQVHGLLGMTSAAEVDGLVVSLLNSDLKTAMHIVSSVADQGADMRQFARDLVERLRALLLLVATRDHSLIDTGTDDVALLDEWAQRVEAGRLVQWIKLLSNLDYQLRTSAYGHLPLELALVEALVAPVPAAAPAPASAAQATRSTPAKPRMLKSSASKQEPPASKQEPPASKQEPPASKQEPPASKQEPPAAESDERSEEQPPEGQGQDTQQTPPAQAPTAQHGTRKGHTGHHQSEEQQVALRQVSAELSLLERVEAIWPDVVRDVKPHDMKLQAILNDVHPVNVEGNTVILQARSYFHFSQVEKNLRSHQIVEEVLSQHMGQRFGMRCVYQEQEKPEDLRSQIQSSLRDPHVKAARNIFSADVIDIEPAET